MGSIGWMRRHGQRVQISLEPKPDYQLVILIHAALEFDVSLGIAMLDVLLPVGGCT